VDYTAKAAEAAQPADVPLINALPFFWSWNYLFVLRQMQKKAAASNTCLANQKSQAADWHGRVTFDV
jgi:hypothetical protein